MRNPSPQGILSLEAAEWHPRNLATAYNARITMRSRLPLPMVQQWQTEISRRSLEGPGSRTGPGSLTSRRGRVKLADAAVA